MRISEALSTLNENNSFAEVAANIVVNTRNAMLSECDWTQAADAPLSEEQKAEWRSYRQALRDITKQPGFPWKVEEPVSPKSNNDKWAIKIERSQEEEEAMRIEREALEEKARQMQAEYEASRYGASE